MCDPGVLPESGFDQTQLTPQKFQNLGDMLTANLVSTIMGVLFPYGRLWAQRDLAPRLKYDDTLDPDDINRVSQQLYLRDLSIMAMLESASDARRRIGFRTAQIQSLTNLIVSGDSLEYISDDLAIQVFRPDEYVTKRACDGAPLWHAIKLEKDVYELSDEDLAKAEVNRAEFETRSITERYIPVFTLVEWQPATKKWVIRQEINGKKVRESEETVTPYVSTALRLYASEDYGRGQVERYLSDLLSFDNITGRKLDFAAMCSTFWPVVDENATALRPTDLEKPSGSVLLGKVREGVPQEVGFIKVDKANDFSVVDSVEQDIRERLGQAFLFKSASVRDSERTTAFEVANTTIKELEGALGTSLTPISDQKQLPIYERVEHVCEKRKLIRPLSKQDKSKTNPKVLTGVAALAKQAEAQGFLALREIVAGIGEQAMAAIDQRVLLDAVAQSLGIYKPGLIKSEQQVRAEIDAALQTQARALAQQTAIETAGQIAVQQTANKG